MLATLYPAGVRNPEREGRLRTKGQSMIDRQDGT